MGIKFFVRSNRGVEFTPEGKEFLGYAVSLLEQKQRIESLYGESRSSIAPVHFMFHPAVSLYRGRFPAKCSRQTQEDRHRIYIERDQTWTA